MKKITTAIVSFLIISVFYCSEVRGQFEGGGSSSVNRFLKPSDTLNKSRRNVVLIIESTLFAVGISQIGGVNEKNTLNSQFHFVDDNSTFLQMDKSSHVFSAYQLSSFSTEALRWGGMSRKRSLLYGTGISYLFLTTTELMNGFSRVTGASKGDLVANTIGCSLYFAQDLLWNEQRIITKFSSQKIDFVSSNSEDMKSEIVSEFNGQTYWLSANIKSFFRRSTLPRWLNIAAGHGVEGVSFVPNGYAPPANAFHQYYLSLDVDFTKIRTKSPILKTFFFLFNYLKVPSPTLEINSKGSMKFHGIYF